MTNPALTDRQQRLARLLQKHPKGMKAQELLSVMPDYGAAGDTPDTARKRLLRDLKKLVEHDLAEYEEGKRRHTLWYPGRRKTVDMMPAEQAVAITALSLFGELPLDEGMARRITPLIDDARQSLQNEGRHYATLNRKIATKPWVARRKLTSGIAREIFDTVLEATLREKKISFGYRSTKGKTISRKSVSPLALLSYREIVYLAFYVDGDDAPMVWPLHRFQWVEIVPGSRLAPPEGWDLDAFVRGWSPIPDSTEVLPTVVKLRFLNEDAVRNLRDAPCRIVSSR